MICDGANKALGEARDAITLRDYVGPGYIMHRRVGSRDLYAIYNASQGSECFFRATGRVELWDPLVVPVKIGGTDYVWQPYEFSWRFGMQDDCAHQGYHGLKEQVADEFMGLGAIRRGHPSCRREAEKPGTRYHLWSSVQMEEQTLFYFGHSG